MNELALFAGSGGGIWGGHLLGWRTVCAVELDPYAAGVLVARQNDGTMPPFPIWDDVRTFDGRPWRGCVDVVTGGFPCQDISVAGRGAGLEGERSGLWREMARIIREVGPRYVLVENSPALVIRGIGTVLGDLASMGYDAQWGVLGADDAGAPHRRKRIWILAYTDRLDGIAESITRREQQGASDPRRYGTERTLAYANSLRKQQQTGHITEIRGRIGNSSETDASDPNRITWWSTEPDVGRVADGVAHRSHRLRALGNGQVPAVVALAWRMLRP